MSGGGMSLYLLVHGAWHGGWCWSDIQERLRAAGHRSVAPDLPCDDTSAGWKEYAATAMSAIRDREEELIVVGHSLGGGVLPIIAMNRPVTRMVFVCSAPPEPGKSLDESLGHLPGLTEPQALAFRDCTDDRGRYLWPDFDTARYAMYADCAEEIALAAYDRLRPQATKPFTERLSIPAWPDVPVTAIVCAQDRMGRPEPLRELARRRFGVEVVELPGGHSPFLSQPGALTHALLDIVTSQ
jgi:pimeloyl-ACP methyl ester carboxylesterase